ncbi:hypothetical protein Drorol1_Dr00008330 [Drosera rotundifolia]
MFGLSRVGFASQIRGAWELGLPSLDFGFEAPTEASSRRMKIWVLCSLAIIWVDVDDAALINEPVVMSAELEVEKQDSTTDIATNKIINENLANVQEENQKGAEAMESTPTVEQDAEADSTLVGESVVMMETEVGKQDYIAETVLKRSLMRI